MAQATETLAHDAESRAILQSVFGHAQFRAGQAEAVAALVDGRDVAVLFPTGGGKSLCYQLPALVRRRRGEGPTVVISPLIALMQDQVEALRGRGVAAAALHSAQDELEQRAVIGNLRTGKLDLLYVSPERAALSGFRRLLDGARVALLAIDEAHCISQWGHDFRPEYRELGDLRARLGVPTIALTATATPRTLSDISESLGLRTPVVVSGDFHRPNLSFAVQHVRTHEERLLQVTAEMETLGLGGGRRGRVIIYCATRKKAEWVAEALGERGLVAGFYHAGRTARARERTQRAFDVGKSHILVATSAFGMGVDYPDVRFIAHFQAPGSLEAYYQEAGRAGRDGEPARCLLFFGASDMVTQRFLGRQQGGSVTQQRFRAEALAKIEAFAHSVHCRQREIVAHFTGAESALACGVCDVCQGTRVAPVVVTATRPREVDHVPLDAAAHEVIVEAVGGLARPVGKILLAKALRGSRARKIVRLGLTKLTQHGMLVGAAEEQILDAIEALIRERRLERRGQKYPTVWLAGRPVRPGRATSAARRAATPLTGDAALRRELTNYCQRTARALHWKSYMVFSRKVIEEIAAARPDSLWALEQIHGVGPAKVGRFGEDVLEMVRRVK
ncbi:MAG: ATP-dependent DNA helicase RecQ [Myxococcota bacterium]